MRGKFEVTLSTETAAFDAARYPESSTGSALRDEILCIFDRIAQQLTYDPEIGQGRDSGVVYDSDGHAVGSWALTF